MSIASCFVIVALWIVRLFKSLPRRMIYPLWALAFYRLMIPFTITTDWSLFNFTGGLVKRVISIETITHDTVSIPGADDLAIMNTIGAAKSYIPLEYHTKNLREIFIISSKVWAVIVVATLILAAISLILARRELKKAVFLKDNIYCSDILLSPVLMGVLHPRIILPTGIDPNSVEGSMILAHENVHRIRLDNLWRILAIIIVCLHWFNPLVWVMIKLFYEDMELSCDETVFRKGKYSVEERKDYASLLLHFAKDKRLFSTSAFGHLGIKARILNVLNYKRLTVIGTVTSVVILLVIALLLVTNPSLRG
ncbi:M56 family metallopeptidase [Mobilitalea sibirica]|uniref:M56 family metallopeptidase n=2 Tax=Mobilitalea sibirica TaxID=1462919 RepID=A0A8J7GY93_9FIRM|nr:M56 family metallopeptidase [Mobilitalea sibirica]MBH1940389.1 M56 family metallopeptidase [Mobilitalea sibirica]